MPEAAAKPPFRLAGFDHIVIRARDPARLIAFYRAALGCEVAHEQPGIQLTHLRVGSQLIDIIPEAGPLSEPGDAPVAQPARNVDHVCLQVTPFDGPAIRAHLKKLGIEATEPGERYGAGGNGLSLYFQDPEGNRLELRGA